MSQIGGASKKFNLKLRKFDMNRINHTNVVVLVGRRASGKSVCIRDLLYHNQTLPCGTVISGTEGSNQFFTKIVPKMFIHDEYTPMILANLVKRQKNLGLRITKEITETGRTNIDPRTFLIMDDCMFDSSWTRDKNIRYLFMNGRHIQTMVVISMQDPMGIPPALRNNTDFIFIFRNNFLNQREKLYHQWAGMFPDFDTFCQVMNQCTENYECLVIDNNAKSNKIEDQVFWYKANNDLPEFKLCSPVFWHQQAQQQAHGGGGGGDGYHGDSMEFDPTMGGARRRFNLIVDKK